MIQLFNTHVTDEAKSNVNDVLDSTWLNEGAYVKQFETKLKEDWGFANPNMVNSCTSALHLALICSGVGPGDEVILPAQTFVATGMAVLMTGAKPVFCDIDPKTGNMSPESFGSKITEKTKAVIPVHWGGNPCDMSRIRNYADDKISIIEDAAHAFGSVYQRKPIGSLELSDFTCFSFQAIKFLTSGDGGAVCTSNEELAEEVARRKWFGIDRSKMKRHFEGDRNITIQELGFKYNMNDFVAALGVGNLSDVKDRLLRRQAIAASYNSQFNLIDGITPMAVDPGGKYGTNSAYWLYTVLVEDRERFIRMMRSKEIPVSVVDRRIDEHPVFGGLTKGLHGQRTFDKKQVSIPVHDALTDEDYNYIIDSVKGGW